VEGYSWWEWGQAEKHSEEECWDLLIPLHMMPQAVIKGTIPYFGTSLPHWPGDLDTSMEDYWHKNEPGLGVGERVCGEISFVLSLTSSAPTDCSQC
jgi:hypothetical protein